MRELENNLITFSDMLLEKVLRGYQRRAMSIADTELLSHLLANGRIAICLVKKLCVERAFTTEVGMNRKTQSRKKYFIPSRWNL